RRIFDAVERPTVFPATVFVSVASGHLTLLAVGQVLQRSLEPADIGSTHRGGGSLAGREGRPDLPVMAAAHQMFDSKKLAARPTGGLAPVVYGSSPTLYWHVVQEGSAPLLNHCGYWLLPSFIA
ncbi:hypothetical protein, partial [Bifidobacterium longum]|uniref:hypothetical protein n=1 Tax=Bifidobacterium longum TaxID=216816 RepID=UPI0022AFF6FF